MYMTIEIIRKPIALDNIKRLAEETFGDMVKMVVDVERQIIAAGGELHSDAESVLLEDGSQQRNLWGINFFPGRPEGNRTEFVSLINIRPSQGNRGQEIEDPQIRQVIGDIMREKIA